MATARITEIFHSLQGEGATVGMPTTFVRLTGCSLRCSWCDSTYAFHGGKQMTVAQIVAELDRVGSKRVCVTGGEPLDQPDATLAIIQACLASDRDVILETSGALPIGPVDAMPGRDRIHISLDIKCPASNMHARNDITNLKHLRADDQVKFVLSDGRDYAFAKAFLAAHALPCPVLLQPMWPSPDPVTTTTVEDGVMDLPRLADAVLADGLDVRVGTQLHKHIWGHQKGR